MFETVKLKNQIILEKIQQPFVHHFSIKMWRNQNQRKGVTEERALLWGVLNQIEVCQTFEGLVDILESLTPDAGNAGFIKLTKAVHQFLCACPTIQQPVLVERLERYEIHTCKPGGKIDQRVNLLNNLRGFIPHVEGADFMDLKRQLQKHLTYRR